MTASGLGRDSRLPMTPESKIKSPQTVFGCEIISVVYITDNVEDPLYEERRLITNSSVDSTIFIRYKNILTFITSQFIKSFSLITPQRWCPGYPPQT